MKTVYEAPVQEIVTFEAEDIITTSSVESTTLPSMNDAGVGDWGSGDSIDIGDLIGRN